MAMYTPDQMKAHTENIKHWQELGEKDRAESIVYSDEVYRFMVNTPEHQEVIATLTYDNCTTLIRRDKQGS